MKAETEVSSSIDLPADIDEVESKSDVATDESRGSRNGVSTAAVEPMVVEESVGVPELVAEFSALRQMVRLQTRGGRQLHDDVTQTLESLNESAKRFDVACQLMQNVARTDRMSSTGGSRESTLKSLCEFDEALDRARSEFERVRGIAAERIRITAYKQVDDAFATLSFWRRFAAGSLRTRILDGLKSTGDSNLWQGVATGFDLVAQRLKKSLQNERIEAMICIGKPVDPDAMVVIEAENDPSPAGTVLAEIRRGYLLDGKPLRLAEVKASKGPA